MALFFSSCTFSTLVKLQQLLRLTDSRQYKNEDTFNQRNSLLPNPDAIVPAGWTSVSAVPRDDVDNTMSPACRPSFGGKQNISRVYFAHTRKAGGTTIRRFLKQLATDLNYELVVNEATKQEYPIREDTLYVTNLRDPVDRIISDYKYEGRWDCEQLVHNKSGFVPSLENQRSLEEDIQFMTNIVQRRNCKKTKRALWRCAEECYTRWFGKNFNCIQNYTSDWQGALEKLMKYDIIIITDWLTDPNYVQGLEALFGVENATSNNLSTKQSMHCFNESHEWNSRIPMDAIKNETRDHLHQLNRNDIQMYKRITHCPGGVVFPDAHEQ